MNQADIKKLAFHKQILCICLYKNIKNKNTRWFSSKGFGASIFIDASVKPVSDKKKIPQTQIRQYQ